MRCILAILTLGLAFSLSACGKKAALDELLKSKAIGLREDTEYGGTSVGASSVGAPHEKTLPLLEAIPNVTTLYLSHYGAGDDLLMHLAALTNLRKLHIEITNPTRGGTDFLGMTDAGLQHLKGVRNLETIILEGAEFKGNGFRHLKDLPAFREVQFRRACKIYDGVFEGLKECKSLERSASSNHNSA